MSRRALAFARRQPAALAAALLLAALGSGTPPAAAQTTAFDPLGQRLRVYIELRPWATAGPKRDQPPFELVNWAGAVGDAVMGLPRGWCLASNGHPFAPRVRSGPSADMLALESCIETLSLRLVRPAGTGHPVDSFAALSDLEALGFTDAYWLRPDARPGRDYTMSGQTVRLDGGADARWIAKLTGDNAEFLAQSQMPRLGTAARLQMGYDVIASSIQTYDRMGRAVFAEGLYDARLRTVYDPDGFRPLRTEFLPYRQSASKPAPKPAAAGDSAPNTTIRFFYDDNGRLSRLDMPPFPADGKEPAFEQRSWRFTFSSEGRLQALHQEGQARPVRFEHDRLGRLIEITWPDLARESLVYVGDTDRIAAWIDRQGCIFQYGRMAADERNYRVLETKSCRQGFVHTKDYRIVDGKVTGVLTSTDTEQKSTKR